MDINEIELKINDSLIFRRFERIDWKQIGNLLQYLLQFDVIPRHHWIYSVRQSWPVEKSIQFELEHDWEEYRKYSVLSSAIWIRYVLSWC